MADFRLFGGVTVDASDAVQQLDRLENEVAQANVAFREQQSAAAAAGRALDKLKADTLANAEAVAAARRELVAAEQAQLKLAASAKIAQQALRDAQQAQGGLTQSSGAARAAMTNLGQQIGDVTQGLVLGVNPATIFAQQAGQVAFAVQGMGGAMSGVARFLGGPWGIALTTAIVALSPFIGKLFEADNAARVAKDGSLSFAREVGVVFDGISSVAGRVFDPMVSSFERAAANVIARLPSFRDLVAKGLRNVDTFTGLVGGRLFGVEGTNLAAGYERTRGRAVARARKEDDLDSIYQLIDEANAGQATRELMQRITDEASRKSADAAKKLADENRKLAEAYNPVLAAQQDYRKALEDISKAEARGIVTAASAADARLAAAEKLRQARLKALGYQPTGPIKLADAGDLTNSLGARGYADDLAREMERVLGPNGLGRELGIRVAGDFGRKALEVSQIIGGSIGQSFARSLQRASGLASFFDRASPGLGTAFGDGFNRLLNGFERLTPNLGKLFDRIFGSGSDFAKFAGRAAGGAAVGGVVANVFGLGSTGAQIGGAIGASLEKPLGKALNGIFKGLGDFAGPIGSIVGSLLGGLFKGKNPFADARITTTSTGVDSSIFNQRGSGSAQQGMTIAGAVGSQLKQIAASLGGEIKAGLNLGAIGFSGSEYYFNPTGGDFKGAGVQRFATAEEAVSAAVTNALSTGAIAGSPKVQAALQRYASNVNQAVAEALKVKGLEDLLDNSANPYSAALRAFEKQAAQRLTVARDYGFYLLQVERVNAEERKKLIERTLEQSIGSAKALLEELQFGSRATGSFGERRNALLAERDRLLGLAKAGDDDAVQKLTQVLEQLLDVSQAGYGATDPFATDRASTVNLLQQLVAQRQSQIEAAATAAKVPDPQLSEANASLDDLVTLNQRIAASLAQIAAQGGFSGGGGEGLAGLYARAVV